MRITIAWTGMLPHAVFKAFGIDSPNEISVKKRLNFLYRVPYVQGVTTDSPTFVMAIEFRCGHQPGRTIAHSKAENVEFFPIVI